MPPLHPYKPQARCARVRALVAAMEHGDSIVVPSKNYATYANAMRDRGARSRSQSLSGTGTVRVWLDTGR